MNEPLSYLCGGSSWDSDGPVLSLALPDGRAAPVRLEAGTELRFAVLDGGAGGGARFCLGASVLDSEGQRRQLPCPGQYPAGRGYQCESCFTRDDLRHMHQSHRNGYVPRALEPYLAQPHWLYVATFAGGRTKVGTASDRRKDLRLAEQGAIAAQYVARADNGRVVRVLEDRVTAVLGLVQAVRSGAKAAELARHGAVDGLQSTNDRHAAAARALLAADTGLRGFEVVQQRWQPPARSAAVLEAGALPYPLGLHSGEHGLIISAVLGPTALVRVDGSEEHFLADLSQLKGRRLVMGPYRSCLPALQAVLF